MQNIEERPNRIKIYGNATTMNFDEILYTNILNSEYFVKDLMYILFFSSIHLFIAALLYCT